MAIPGWIRRWLRWRGLAWIRRWLRWRGIARIARRAASEPPLLVQIENTNLCNSRCVFCPHARMKRDKGFMPLELYRRIILQCAEAGVPKVGVHNFGEPLLDGDLVRRIELAKELGIRSVMMYTNGLLLEGEVARRLLSSGLDELYVSVDGYDAKEYSELRPGADLGRVERNLRAFAEAKRAAGRGPKVVIKVGVRRPLDKGRARRTRDSLSGLADVVETGGLTNWPSEDDLLFIKSVKPVFPCSMLFSSLFVLIDGRVALCCLDYEGEYVLGNLMTQNLMEVWRGDVLARVRAKHLAGRFGEIFYCARCGNTADLI